MARTGIAIAEKLDPKVIEHEERIAILRAQAEKDMARLADMRAGRAPEDEEGIAELDRWYESQSPEWIASMDEIGRRGSRR